MGQDINISKDMALTPDKREALVYQIQKEIEQINETLRKQGAPKAVLEAARRNKDSLQAIVNKILAKKGVITPDETNSTLDAISKSKKERLESDYSTTLKRVAVLGSLLIAAWVALHFIKKSKQGQ